MLPTSFSDHDFPLEEAHSVQGISEYDRAHPEGLAELGDADFIFSLRSLLPGRPNLLGTRPFPLLPKLCQNGHDLPTDWGGEGGRRWWCGFHPYSSGVLDGAYLSVTQGKHSPKA